MYMGIDVDSTGFDWDSRTYVLPDDAAADATVTDAGADDTPWYARPTEAILGLIGNITYQTSDYTIASRDGELIIDRRGDPAPAPAERSPGLVDTLSRVPSVVWWGAGALILFSMARR